MAEMEHNSDIDSIWDDIDFGDLNLPEDENDIYFFRSLGIRENSLGKIF